MKKTLNLIVSLALVLAFVFTTTAFAEEAEATAVPTVSEGILSIATNAAFPPYEYTEGDEFVGIDMEIAGAIAEKLGLTLEVNDVEFGSIIGGIQAGKYDLGIAGMTKTEERLESVNFSETYAKGIQVIIVKEDSAIASPDDLTDDPENADDDDNANYIIGVQQDTTGDIYCCDDFGQDRVVEFKTGADAVQALITDKVDCVIIDNEPAKSYVAANEGLKILEANYVEEEYAIAISKDNEELLTAVNAVLAELTEDGTLDAIISKYIGDAEEDTEAAEEAPAEEAAADGEVAYTQQKVFDGTYGFGDAEITVKTNDDMTAFDITFVCFDEDQELIGTITNGICMVSYDETGFVAGDCQQIWDDACASENAWEPIA